MIGDYFKLALLSITHRKLRSWLTMLGIFVGIMAVVALISLGEGLQSTINEEFEKVGSNRISILPGGGGAEAALFGAAGLSSEKLTEDDIDVIRKVRGVEYVTGAGRKSVNVEFDGEIESLSLWCVMTDEDSLKLFEDLPFFSVDRGKMLQKGDVYKTVIGDAIAADVFDNDIKVNDRITMDDKTFTVIGIYEKTSNPEHDYKVSITQDSCEELFNITDLSGITVTVKKGFNNTEVAEVIEEKLRRYRNVKEGEEDFTIATPEDIMRIFLSIVDLVQFTLTGIAAISLVVGGVGIMNTMYTSVIERTDEIGIMKAVGAKNSNILMLFMIEAGLLGTVGGVIGVVLGLLLAKLVEILAVASGLELLKVSISMPLILGALAFSFVMGSLSGILPSMRAAKLKPVEALKK